MSCKFKLFLTSFTSIQKFLKAKKISLFEKRKGFLQRGCPFSNYLLFFQAAGCFSGLLQID